MSDDNHDIDKLQLQLLKSLTTLCRILLFWFGFFIGLFCYQLVK